MTDKTTTYETPEVIDSFDELEIIGDTPALSTGGVSGSPAGVA